VIDFFAHHTYRWRAKGENILARIQRAREAVARQPLNT